MGDQAHSPAPTSVWPVLLLVLLLLPPLDSTAQIPETTAPPNRSVSRAVLYSLLPGAGHAYLGDYPRAGAYSVLPAAFLAGGYALDRTTDSYSYADQNLGYHFAEKTYQLSIATTYLSARYAALGIEHPPSERAFLLAPFSINVLADPWVHAGWLLATTVTTLEALTRRAPRYDDITTIERAGEPFSRSAGTALYAGELTTASIITAAAEEAFWRGMLQEEFQRNAGRWPGLILTSALFGLAHSVGPGSSTEKTDRFANGLLGALYLGMLFDARSHNLEPSIAAHFWYNVAVGTTVFLVDPENNPLQFKILFTF